MLIDIPEHVFCAVFCDTVPASFWMLVLDANDAEILRVLIEISDWWWRRRSN